MKQKFIYYTKELAIFILLLTLLSNILSFYKSQTLNKASLPINQVELLNKERLYLKQNKPILIHFWATWCPTCKLEANNIERISQKFNVITIAVKSGSNKDIQKYLKEKGLSFHVVNDKNGTFAQLFHISAFPTTFIYTKEHTLLFSDVGYTSTLGLYLRMWWASL
jgi:thiol-disulfide isomerase/thioredoxin